MEAIAVFNRRGFGHARHWERLMKAIVALVAVTMAFGSQAIAQSKSKQERERAERSATTVSPHAPTTTRRARSSNPQWDVYRPNGDYAGSDPDPRVRFKLHFDDPTNGDS
jgi:hypothetical protein